MQLLRLLGQMQRGLPVGLRLLFAAARRRSRFSLAGLIVTLTVICALLGARFWWAKSAGRDRPVAARLTQLGGFVDVWNTGIDQWERRLGSLLGVEVFRAQSVHIDCARLSAGQQEECLALIQSFPALTQICVENCDSFRADDLGQMRSFRTIWNVNLQNTGIRDELARFLKVYPNLSNIDIQASPISDRFLDEIVAFPKLRSVYFRKTNITFEGFNRFKAARPDVDFSADVSVFSSRAAD